MERRYNEDEVAVILRDAAQAAAARLPADRRGLTLAELKGIGAEVGIDPGAIERAAVALDAPKATMGSRLLGGPVVPQYERWIDGQLDPADIPELVLAIRRMMGRQGILRTELGAVEWSARDANGGRYVTIRPSGNRTLIRVMGNFRDGVLVSSAIGGTAGLAATSVALKAAGITAALGMGALPLVALGVVLPVRLLWRWRSRTEDATLRATLDELETMLTRMMDEKTTSSEDDR